MKMFYMTVVTLGAMAILASGCASLGLGGSGGLTEQDQILQTLAKWQVGLETPDLDTFLAAYSDAYESDGVDKDRLTDLMAVIMDAGLLDDADAILEGAEISVDGDTAEVTGITSDGPEGTESNSFILEKEEDGVWRIIAALNDAPSEEGSTNPLDEDQLLAIIGAWKAALLKKDIDSILGMISETFGTEDGYDKAGYGKALKARMDAGLLDAAEISADDLDVEIDADQAWVDGMVIDVPSDRSGLEFGFEKEADGVWRVVYLNE